MKTHDEIQENLRVRTAALAHKISELLINEHPMVIIAATGIVLGGMIGSSAKDGAHVDRLMNSTVQNIEHAAHVSFKEAERLRGEMNNENNG
jgi:hypothetical protein